MIDIETLKILKGDLPRQQYRKVVAWAKPRHSALLLAWTLSQSDLDPGKIP